MIQYPFVTFQCEDRSWKRVFESDSVLVKLGKEYVLVCLEQWGECLKPCLVWMGVCSINDQDFVTFLRTATDTQDRKTDQSERDIAVLKYLYTASVFPLFFACHMPPSLYPPPSSTV